MRLIKQATLHFQEGNSDKIYEADLCDVGQGQFVVNFRYGRRGGNLKEGTKTKSPVNEAKAESEFAKLVQSKMKKGYNIIEGVGDLSDFGFSGDAVADEPEVELPTSDDVNGRDARILNDLRNPEDAEASNWPLSRVIWRAGELGLTAAEPLIWNHMDTNQKMLNYSIAWALGRIGTKASLAKLQYIQTSRRYDKDVKRIALESERQIMFRIGQGDDYVKGIVNDLPVPLTNAYENKDATQLQESIVRWLGGTRTAAAKDYLLYEVLYQIDDELTRPVVLDFIKNAPLTPPHFRVIRHLFKAAELRHDAQVFGLIAHRFATTSHNYQSNGYYQGSFGKAEDGTGQKSVYIREFNNPQFPWGRTVTLKDATDEETTLAYSKATRDYMRRRVWRVLRRLGKAASEHYVPMATGVLLAYRDANAQNSQRRTQYGYRYENGNWRYYTNTTYYGPWATFITFNHILYTNSTRFEWRNGRSAWRATKEDAHLDTVSKREEAFPALWNAQPFALLHLLDESKVEVVHHFAVNALNDMPEFCATLPMDAILMMLEAAYERTAAFGFKLFESRYDKNNPDLYALVKLATCSYGRGRVKALQWLKPNASKVAQDDRLLAVLLTSSHASARDFAQQSIKNHMPSHHVIQQTISRAVAFLMGDDVGVTHGLQIVGGLTRAFGAQLSVIGSSVINDLLSHNTHATTLLAAHILKHQTIDFIPLGQIKSLIASQHAAVRVIGMEIFAKLSESILLDSEELLVALAVHELEDLRKAAHGPIRKLAAANGDFALRVATMFIELLQLAEPSEGVHKDILSLLKEDLFERLRYLDQDTIFTLLRAKSTAAKELGGLLLGAYVPSSQLSILEIAELGRNEILSVRQACWSFMEAELFRIKTAKQTALRTLDSDWEDTRQFAFSFFEEKFEDHDWTPELLVSLCDSIRPDVQQFGKRMIQRFFKEADGLEYLIRLSEHPSIDLQLFATNYLDRFASDRPDEIAKLEYYFTSVLSRVNKGGVAKARIFEFLNKEAHKSEQAASIIGSMLSRQSASIAIQDRAKAIETMVTIQQTYPHIELALSLIPVEVRHGV